MPKGSWKEVGTKFMYEPGIIFVFGSNLAGRHGLGAAKFARENYGARYGVGQGRTGDAYAIPTKSATLEILHLETIRDWVKIFIADARKEPNSRFKLTRIGCGLAGYKDWQIAPMFRGSPDNVIFPEEWKSYLDVA